MKTWRVLLAALLLVLCGGIAQAASSYTFRSDSYAWETAANTVAWDRTCTSYPGDDDKATLTLTGGFKFRFAGTDYTTVRVLANGGLQFGTDTGFFRTYTNTALPAAAAGAQSGCAASATTNVILAYWTDLNPSQNGSGGVTWEQKGTSPNRYLVVSWNGVYQYNTSTPYTFQIILYEAAYGVNGEFKFQYGNANASGSNATIGVQVSSSDYTQYSYNSGYNANGSAIRWFVPSGTPTRRAEYRFDEWNYSGRVGEVADSSGNSNNGVRIGNATTSATARICRSLSIPLDTTSASHAVDTLLDVNSGVGDTGAVTFWYQAATAWNNSAAMLLDATSTTSRPFFLVRQSDGSLRATVTDSNGLVVSVATPAQSVTASTWKHVAFTWRLAVGSNQSILRIYIDGFQVAATTTTTSGTLDNSIATLFVGDNRSSTAPTNATLRSANGLIDELRVYNYEISALELTADMAMVARVCLPPLDHYELSVPTTSLTCQQSTITVKACSTNASSCSVETSVNGTAALTTSAGTLSPSTVSFVNGVATATLSWPGGIDGSTVTVTLGAESTAASNPRRCCPDGVNCAAANSCTTNFKNAAFIVSDSAGGTEVTLPTHTAGTQSANFYYLRAVRKSSSTQACEAALTGTKTVNWGYECHDPASCSTSNLMTVASFSPATAPSTPTPKASTLIQRNNKNATLGYTAVSMEFDSNGNAPFKLSFADVGKTLLHFNHSVTVGSSGSDSISGKSLGFVTKPFGFTVSNITKPASPYAPNPAASDANGLAFVAAGSPFRARVTATTSSGAAAPNFGKEDTPEGVLLTPLLTAPSSGGIAGSVDNATVTGDKFTTGFADVANLSYSEVGIIRLTPSLASADYLGAGTGAITGTQTGTIGRFIPAGFTVTAKPVTNRSAMAPACNPASVFTYLDEDFKLEFKLTAVNAANVPTQNYSGSFAKLDLTDPAKFKLAGVAGATTFKTTDRLSVSAPTGSWAAGQADASLTARVARIANPDGPFATAQFGIAPVDTDGVTLTTPNLNTDPAIAGDETANVGQIPLRYGRLRLQNGMSAGDRPLTLPLAAQYWDSSTNTFKTNDLDSCTRVTAANLSFGNFRKTLAAADAVMNPNTVTVNPAGNTFITFAKSASGHVGSMDVAIALNPGANPTDASCMPTGWSTKSATTGANLVALRGAWCGGNSDPSARATWGLYRGSNGIVYQRENF